MYQKIFFIILTTLLIYSCSKKEVEYTPKDKTNPYVLYNEGLEAFARGDYFFAEKKFTEAELNFEIVEHAAKSAIMSSYALYGINFYNQALENLERYIRKYPADNNVVYAHYLIAMIYYEQISDEKKDLKPLIKAKEKFEFIIEKYPNTDFALDSSYKINLINDILASKEMYIGKHYIKKEKWIPAINRFKTIVIKYDTTIYVEEALHRLVEIHYRIGLTNESKRYASMLGYNYKSSEWYKKSYKVFNRNYRDPKKSIDKKKGNFITRKFRSLFD